jgi:hypothetical protein
MGKPVLDRFDEMGQNLEAPGKQAPIGDGLRWREGIAQFQAGASDLLPFMGFCTRPRCPLEAGEMIVLPAGGLV